MNCIKYICIFSNEEITPSCKAKGYAFFTCKYFAEQYGKKAVADALREFDDRKLPWRETKKAYYKRSDYLRFKVIRIEDFYNDYIKGRDKEDLFYKTYFFECLP